MYHAYYEVKLFCQERFFMEIRKGDVFMVDLSPVVGSEQGGLRPAVIVQNDVGNKFSPTTIVACVTSKLHKAKLPTHIELNSAYCSLKQDSILLLEQIRTIDKSRLKEKICSLPNDVLDKMNKALIISLQLA